MKPRKSAECSSTERNFVPNINQRHCAPRLAVTNSQSATHANESADAKTGESADAKTGESRDPSESGKPCDPGQTRHTVEWTRRRRSPRVQPRPLLARRW